MERYCQDPARRRSASSKVADSLDGMEDEEGIEVVLSVGELDATVVALREFLHRVNAVQVQAVVDLGDDEAPALVSCGRLEPIEVVRGDKVVHLPHGVELAPEPPAELPSIPALPPFEVDDAQGTITGPLGGVEAVARAVESLAEHLGGRSVALAFYATTSPDLPLGIAARNGEATIVTLGEEQFELPA
jgi:hypothetical protein